VSVIRRGFGQNYASNPSIVLAAFFRHFDQRFQERQQLKRGCISMQQYTGVSIAAQAAGFAWVWMEKGKQRKVDNIFICCYYNFEN
jgi:hypothetical protein